MEAGTKVFNEKIRKGDKYVWRYRWSDHEEWGDWSAVQEAYSDSDGMFLEQFGTRYEWVLIERRKPTPENVKLVNKDGFTADTALIGDGFFLVATSIKSSDEMRAYIDAAEEFYDSLVENGL